MDSRIAQHLIGIGIGTIIVAAAIKKAQEIFAEGQKEREELRLNSLKTISAMNRAAGIILERIRNGEYLDKTIEDVNKDWEFETIMIFNKY